MSDCKARAHSLSAWLATERDGAVLAREQDYFDHKVNDIFGYNALQLGMPECAFLRNSRIPLRVGGGEHPAASVKLRSDELPFASASLDLVILPHNLEFAAQPHQTLREVERVLMPEGNLLISGFNPHSLWGWRRLFKRRQGYPWCGRFIALSRLKDWLALLGFEVMEVRFTAYPLPIRPGEPDDRPDQAGTRWWRTGGGIYFVHAIKRVPGMRLIKPKWNHGLVNKLLPVAPKMNNKNITTTDAMHKDGLNEQ